MCVFEIDGEKTQKQFREKYRATVKYCVKSWEFDDKWIIQNPGMVSDKEPADVFAGALISEYLFESFGLLKMENYRFKYMAGLQKVFILNAAQNYYLGMKYTEIGNPEPAIYWFSKAQSAAPEWAAPGFCLKKYEEKGFKVIKTGFKNF
jgi:hypothetical protein